MISVIVNDACAVEVLRQARATCERTNEGWEKRSSLFCDRPGIAAFRSTRIERTTVRVSRRLHILERAGNRKRMRPALPILVLLYRHQLKGVYEAVLAGTMHKDDDGKSQGG